MRRVAWRKHEERAHQARGEDRRGQDAEEARGQRRRRHGANHALGVAARALALAHHGVLVDVEDLAGGVLERGERRHQPSK